MAQILPVSGGAQPVFAVDVLNGSQLSANVTYSPQGVPTNFMGPKLDFFAINLSGGNANPIDQCQVNGAVELALQTIQTVSTVAIYQVSNTVVDTNFSVALFPVGSFNTAQDGTNNSATNMAALLSGLGNVSFPNGSSFDFSGTVANTVAGFRLATTEAGAC